jgi:ribosomal protein S18 acetylase RimI-like enzyme
MQVPPVLRAGNHRDVELWRREQQLLRTKAKRPDMFAAFQPQTKEDMEIYRRVTQREKLTYDCRRATAEDMPALLALGQQASAFLKEQGVAQWQDNFPNEAVFTQDIQAGNCWLFTHEEEPAGCVSLYLTPEKDYEAIQGQWLTQGPYGTIHRLTVGERYRGRGLAGEMLTFMEDLLQGMGYPSVRVDTHRDNEPMRGLLKKHGYTRCGVIYLTDTVEQDTHRVVYEKVFQ